MNPEAAAILQHLLEGMRLFYVGGFVVGGKTEAWLSDQREGRSIVIPVNPECVINMRWDHILTFIRRETIEDGAPKFEAVRAMYRTEPHDHYCRCGMAIYHGCGRCKMPLRVESCPSCRAEQADIAMAPYRLPEIY